MSTPDEQALIQQVTEALAIQHNPTADEQRRYAAMKVCNSIINPKEHKTYGFPSLRKSLKPTTKACALLSH